MEGADILQENGPSSPALLLISPEDDNRSTTAQTQPLDTSSNDEETSSSPAAAAARVDLDANAAAAAAARADVSRSMDGGALVAAKDDLETHKAKEEDDYMLHRRCVSVDFVAKVSPTSSSPSGDKSSKGAGVPDKVQIDTAAPFESVKAAVSKFGGIVDWKAHRVQTVERRKFIELELEKAHEEMPSYKQQCEAAEEAKTHLLKELESTKRLIEELKLNLERAQTEEQQAKQDSELAKLRVEEMEQGIADEASFAAKAQLEVAKARHAAAVSELRTIKEELQQLRKDYALLISEKEAAEAKAAEALATSKQVEKSVESLTIELITLKQSLESEHSAHLEAEEHRMGAVMAREQDALNWELELKQAEEELDKLKHQMLSTKELKSKLADATTLLLNLKTELAAYMESELTESGKQGTLLEEKKTRGDIEAAINAARKELTDVKLKIEKAMEEVNLLKSASTSLKSELEKENKQLQAVQQREGMASITASSLETELNIIKSEIAHIHKKEQEEHEQMMHLQHQVQEAAREANKAKSIAQTAHNELEKARHEAEEAKAEASTMESKLRAVQKEIEAAKAGEQLALAAINAVGGTAREEDSANGITLTIEEYYELSKRAHEAEEQAKLRVQAAISELESAKESEKRSLKKLEEVSSSVSQRKDALESALQKAEQATQGKLSVENELRKWRAEHGERRKSVSDQHLGAPPPVNTTGSPRGSFEDSVSTLHQRSPRFRESNTAIEEVTAPEPTKAGKKKKKSFFPRIFMFLGRRKTHSSSSKTD